MNFDSIENLSPDELKKLYNSIIEEESPYISTWASGYCSDTGAYCFDFCYNNVTTCHPRFIAITEEGRCILYLIDQGSWYSTPPNYSSDSGRTSWFSYTC